jgi:hypothetical protein
VVCHAVGVVVVLAAVGVMAVLRLGLEPRPTGNSVRPRPAGGGEIFDPPSREIARIGDLAAQCATHGVQWVVVVSMRSGKVGMLKADIDLGLSSAGGLNVLSNTSAAASRRSLLRNPERAPHGVYHVGIPASATRRGRPMGSKIIARGCRRPAR